MRSWPHARRTASLLPRCLIARESGSSPALTRYEASWPGESVASTSGSTTTGAHIMETLFRGTPAHGVKAILTGFLVCFSGVLAVVSSLQLIYERIFAQEPPGWRNLPRGILWIVAVLALLAFDGVTNRAERDAGPLQAWRTRRHTSSVSRSPANFRRSRLSISSVSCGAGCAR